MLHIHKFAVWIQLFAVLKTHRKEQQQREHNYVYLNQSIGFLHVLEFWCTYGTPQYMMCWTIILCWRPVHIHCLSEDATRAGCSQRVTSNNVHPLVEWKSSCVMRPLVSFLPTLTLVHSQNLLMGEGCTSAIWRQVAGRELEKRKKRKGKPPSASRHLLPCCQSLSIKYEQNYRKSDLQNLVAFVLQATEVMLKLPEERRMAIPKYPFAQMQRTPVLHMCVFVLGGGVYMACMSYLRFLLCWGLDCVTLRARGPFQFCNSMIQQSMRNKSLYHISIVLVHKNPHK